MRHITVTPKLGIAFQVKIKLYIRAIRKSLCQSDVL